MMTFIASVVIFGLLIFFHEFGHFAVAKMVGIKVHEFSMGFGPKVLGLSGKETMYNIRLFPLGGFVRMAGMDPDEEEVVEKGEGFNDKTILQRAGVIFAGPLMNFVLAVLLFGCIFVFQGVPVPSTEVRETINEDPAEKVGIKPGDRIISINNTDVNEWEEITGIISNNPENEIRLTVERDGVEQTFEIVPAEDENGEGRIGIYPDTDYQKQNPFLAIASGVEYTGQITFLIIDFLGRMIVGNAPADLGGPVRVVYEIDRATEQGLVYLSQLAAFLSINLGLFNLFPIPALDGSRLMFLSVELVRGRPLDPAKENFIHLIGFGLLLMLIVVITYNDILEIFTGN